MTVTFPTPPTAPSLSDPTNFDTRMDAFLVWMAATATSWNATPPYTVGDSPTFAGVTVGVPNFGLVYTSGKLALAQTSSSTQAVALESIGDVEISADTNNSTSGDIVFNTGGTQRAVIKRTTGRLGIGTDDPDGALDVRGVGYFTADNSSTLALNRTGSTGGIVFFYSNGSAAGTISVTASATSYNTSSDGRLKENITPIQGAADIVKMMRPVTCTFIYRRRIARVAPASCHRHKRRS